MAPSDNSGKPDIREALKEPGSFIPYPAITFLVQQRQDLSCAICLDAKLVFAPGECWSTHAATMLPCGHVACRRCLGMWLEEHDTCPFCKLELRYPLCGHQVAARPLDPYNILVLPPTLPDGGRIPDQCLPCRLSTAERVVQEVMPIFRAEFADAQGPQQGPAADVGSERLAQLKRNVAAVTEVGFRQQYGQLMTDW